MREGRTFITNGPSLLLDVDGHSPGAVIRKDPGEKLGITLSWQSFYAIRRVELISNGSVVWQRSLGDEECRQGSASFELEAQENGWLAARLGSPVRDSFYHAIYSHTSPVYIDTGRGGARGAESARLFMKEIDNSMERIETAGRFLQETHRKEVIELFKQGRDVYAGIVAAGET
jgi:hypothetical protein